MIDSTAHPGAPDRPRVELFDLGHVTANERLLDKYGAPFGGHVHCDLVMGVPGGMPGTAEALITPVHELAGSGQPGPRRASAEHADVAPPALACGRGTWRVGMEDRCIRAGRASPREMHRGAASPSGWSAGMTSPVTRGEAGRSVTAGEKGRMDRADRGWPQACRRVLGDGFLDNLEDIRCRSFREAAGTTRSREDADLLLHPPASSRPPRIIRAERDRRAKRAGDKVVDHLSRCSATGKRSTHGSGRFLSVEPSRVARAPPRRGSSSTDARPSPVATGHLGGEAVHGY